MSTRRSYGTGQLYVRTDGRGRETWYGRWRAAGRLVNRKVGVRRVDGSREGLTRAMAEAALRRAITETSVAAAAGSRLTVAEVGERYLRHLEQIGRKRSTVTSVESALRVWIRPALGERSLASVTPDDVEDLIVAMRDAKLGVKSIRNYIGTLSALFRFAMHARRAWAVTNPCLAVDLPASESSDEIRFLTAIEVDALADHACPGVYADLDRALYLTAAMTGLRQGELIALRWSDVDWQAQRIRVRRSHVLGAFDTPKSRRSSRSVPMAQRVAAELDAWSKVTRWSHDGSLVFAEPLSGEVLRRAALMRRYRRALKAARLPETHRFHDLRHTFGTAMAAAGVPMRTLQEWLGHRDMQTTLIYADYVPNAGEVAMVDRAFAGAEASVPGSLIGAR